jgi:thiol-disulfide isomerase/thioredoxin
LTAVASPTALAYAATEMQGTRPTRLALAALLLFAPACEKPPAERASTDGEPRADADGDADPLVGYDLRRLRPRENEPLAEMFERLRTSARDEGKRVVVLFSADWCEPCRHLDLELGNTHPASMIGDVRILELKEDDWAAPARMDEFNDLRRRWEPVLNTYPLLVLLDDEGKRVEEMKEAKARLEAAGLEPTLPIWFDETRRQ